MSIIEVCIDEMGWGLVVELRVLGPVEVVAGGTVVAVAEPRQCAVLAAVAVDAGRLVPVEVLVDRVWGPDPPPGARRTLHTYLTRVRRLLEQPAGEAGDAGGEVVRLVHRTGGYVLEVDPDRVDLHRFRRLVEQARDPHYGDQQRVALLRQALGLCRGEPLAGVPGVWAARLRAGWQQQHLDAVLAWAQAELQVGNPAVVIPVLSELAGEHPLVEPLTTTLMRALHAAGRSAEALERYANTRKLLVEELGTDPGAELRAVHEAILRGGPDHVGSAPTRPPGRQATVVVPAQLPADVYGFAGRAEHLTRLDTLLATATAGAPTAVVISAVSGTAGVGKTALAVHWAHRVADRFPDGQLYVNLRGFDPGRRVMDPAEAVRGFLDALGVPPQRIPPSLDAQAGLYRSQLAGKRVLVVLDNARDAEHARPLLPGTPTALALVTSRSHLTPLIAAGAHPLTLDILTNHEARELLAGRLGAARVTTEPQAVEQIITCCARLPLALSIAAARAQQSGFPLSTLAGELADAAGRLDTLDTGDIVTQIRAVFSWSYTALSPPAGQLFRLLGLHPGPDISAAAAASLAGHPPPQTRPLLAELTRANLLTEHTPGRYTFHDLLRAYATDLAHRIDSDQQRRTITHRMLDHYLHTAYTAERLLSPARDPITLTPAQPGVTPELPAGHQQALDWFTAERPVLLAAVAHAAAYRLDTHTGQLTWTLRTFLDRRGHWHDWAATGGAAVAAAQRLADPTAQARAHRTLAHAYTRLGRLDDAHTHLTHALDLTTQTGDHTGQAHTHHNLADLWERRGNYPQALDHARQALDLHQATGHQRGQAAALNQVGWCHALLGDHHQALTYCQQALTLFQNLDDRDGQAATWDSIGYAHHHLGHHTHALTSYHHALTLYRDLGDRYEEATTLTHLGDTHHATGNTRAARDAWQQALTILNDLNHPNADTVRAKLHNLDQTPTSSS